MNSNLWKIGAAVGSALVAAGASADLLPDGRVKHVLIIGGIAGTFLLALVAKWPHEPADTPDNVVNLNARRQQ